MERLARIPLYLVRESHLDRAQHERRETLRRRLWIAAILLVSIVAGVAVGLVLSVEWWGAR